MSYPSVLFFKFFVEKTMSFNQLNDLKSNIIDNSLPLKELHKFKSIISNQKQLQVIKFDFILKNNNNG